MAGSGSSAEPVCEPADVAVTVRWDFDGNGGLRGQVIAENVSGRACRLPGKPTVTPVGTDGAPLPVQTVVTLEWVQPGYVTVQPGQRAAAPVYWASWCGQRASDRARVSWGDHAATADVHGPPQPECNGRSGNLSSSWFRLTDLPGDRGGSQSGGFAEQQDRAAPGVRFRVQDEQPVDGAGLPVFGLGARAFQRECVLFETAGSPGSAPAAPSPSPPPAAAPSTSTSARSPPDNSNKHRGGRLPPRLLPLIGVKLSALIRPAR